MIREKAYPGINGYLMLFLLLGAIAAGIYGVLRAIPADNGLAVVLWILLVVVAAVCLGGLFVVNPNEARVLTVFGRYTGSAKEAGFWWTNPFAVKARLSLRTRNFETTKLKVNDASSNPIEIAAIVVWRVVETAEALFEVDSYIEYVHMQSEAALRSLAQRYPYDAHKAGEISLSTHTEEASKTLLEALEERLAKAGVAVKEARISHLAYAPEIAAAMLQRQQASAIVAARQQIVEGAVGMVENALDLLSQKNVVQLDDERRAAMVSNLLVVLCSDRAATPVVNTGTIYQ